MNEGLEADVEQGLDNLATWLICVAKRFIPPVVGDLDESCAIHEEYPDTSGRNRPTNVKLVCPRAQLSHPNDENNHLQFHCQCKESHDDSSMHYKGRIYFLRLIKSFTDQADF
ncbi:subtilisin-like protein [Penicillium angulare]|uniref:Subtilisin-like protein n=1 Tax=Penicillium angulare TaxID=116970 RepID=A0A9W9GDD3_9EURO|nr:subtilisin-like protein [Penicillium angulare]